MDLNKLIEHEAQIRYPDVPERGFGTGDYEYPEDHSIEREVFAEACDWVLSIVLDRTAEWLGEHMDTDYTGECDENEVPYCGDYLNYLMKRQSMIEAMLEDYKRNLFRLNTNDN